MQPGGVLRHSGALPGMQQASLGLNNCKHHSEGSGAACVQLPGSHTSCNAASFPAFNPFLVRTALREGQTVLGAYLCSLLLTCNFVSFPIREWSNCAVIMYSYKLQYSECCWRFAFEGDGRSQ